MKYRKPQVSQRVFFLPGIIHNLWHANLPSLPHEPRWVSAGPTQVLGLGFSVCLIIIQPLLQNLGVSLLFQKSSHHIITTPCDNSSTTWKNIPGKVCFVFRHCMRKEVYCFSLVQMMNTHNIKLNIYRHTRLCTFDLWLFFITWPKLLSLNKRNCYS